METKHTPEERRTMVITIEVLEHSFDYNRLWDYLTKDYGKKFSLQDKAAIKRVPDLLAKVSELRQLLLRAEMYVLPTEQTNELLKEIRKTLES